MTIYKLIGGGERAMQLFSLGRDIICIEEDIEEKYVCPERCNGFTTVQRNYPIGSVDLNRNHSSDVLV